MALYYDSILIFLSGWAYPTLSLTSFLKLYIQIKALRFQFAIMQLQFRHELILSVSLYCTNLTHDILTINIFNVVTIVSMCGHNSSHLSPAPVRASVGDMTADYMRYYNLAPLIVLSEPGQSNLCYGCVSYSD